MARGPCHSGKIHASLPQHFPSKATGIGLAMTDGRDDAKAKGGKNKQFAGGRAGGAVMLNLVPRNAGGGRGGLLGGATMVDPNTGVFEFAAVPPGSYYLIAQTQGPAQQRMSARLPLDVGNGDITGVPVRLTPPLSCRSAARPADSTGTDRAARRDPSTPAHCSPSTPVHVRD